MDTQLWESACRLGGDRFESRLTLKSLKNGSYSLLYQVTDYFTIHFVCLSSVRNAMWRNMIFSAPIQDRHLKFSQIKYIYILHISIIIKINS